MQNNSWACVHCERYIMQPHVLMVYCSPLACRNVVELHEYLHNKPLSDNNEL